MAVSDFTALSQDLTVNGALARIREHGAAQQIIYFYGWMPRQRLVGVLPTRRLLLAAPAARLQDIMINRVVTIPETATVLEACEMFVMHKFLAFPVVTPNAGWWASLTWACSASLPRKPSACPSALIWRRFLNGSTSRVAEVRRLAGQAFRLRLPWLAATLGGGICCALVSGCFEATLTSRIILAFFLTLVLGLSKSVSAQSVTVTVESLRGPRKAAPGICVRCRKKPCRPCCWAARAV